VTGTTASTKQGQLGERLTLRRLIAENRVLSMGALAVLLALAATIVLTAVQSGPWRVTDSTSCSAWGSANQSRQHAYARLYVREHGALPSGARDIASVEDAINYGCTQAFSFDEADTLTVLQAIRRQY
jgi:hypothetical protein